MAGRTSSSIAGCSPSAGPAGGSQSFDSRARCRKETTSCASSGGCGAGEELEVEIPSGALKRAFRLENSAIDLAVPFTVRESERRPLLVRLESDVEQVRAGGQEAYFRDLGLLLRERPAFDALPDGDTKPAAPASCPRDQVLRQPLFVQVNAYTAGDQDSPAVSLDVDGDFVVVWDSRSLYPDLSSSIQGQRYAAGGAALGGELQISTATTLRGLFPGIALDADGDFAVVWQNMGDWGIQGRRFAAGGSALGGEFRVNSHTSILGYFALSPAVALQADGDFVVVWGAWARWR